eukprot:SAG22_NODE_1203_length_5178_cov_1.734200_4_plen_89_part_00
MDAITTGTLQVREARMSDEIERELLCLRAEIMLNQAATFSAINAHDNALKVSAAAARPMVCLPLCCMCQACCCRHEQTVLSAVDMACC